MLKQILFKIRCYYMELAGFINDKLVVEELLLIEADNSNQPKITKLDLSLLGCFLLIASLIICVIPMAVNNKLSSSLEIFAKDNYWEDFTLNTGFISRHTPTVYIPGDHQAQIEFAKLIAFFSEEIISKTKYDISNPEELAFKIISESYIANEDPFFVAAMVFSESSFRTHARSKVGARGLMQIMPKTGEYIARKINYQWKGLHTLDNPTVNLRLGISYIQYLKKMFSGNTNKMLIAYNWGPNNVKQGKNPPSISISYSAKIQKLTDNWKNAYIRHSGSKDINILQTI